ncbi:hypothetical protein L7F22_066088 [Adiantum nelumboides]|nr:hypothetical protein [Adiantum nelumboides]
MRATKVGVVMKRSAKEERKIQRGYETHSFSVLIKRKGEYDSRLEPDDTQTQGPTMQDDTQTQMSGSAYGSSSFSDGLCEIFSMVEDTNRTGNLDIQHNASTRTSCGQVGLELKGRGLPVTEKSPKMENFSGFV